LLVGVGLKAVGGALLAVVLERRGDRLVAGVLVRERVDGDAE
jgi:hypothetical protein